jgi:hypothetical protein
MSACNRPLLLTLPVPPSFYLLKRRKFLVISDESGRVEAKEYPAYTKVVIKLKRNARDLTR